jgi:hypothetical protein
MTNRKSQIPAEPGEWAGSQKIAESLLSQMWKKHGRNQGRGNLSKKKETELFVPS